MKKRTGKLALALAALAMLVTTIGCKDPNNGVKTVEEETKSYTVTFNTNGGSAIEAVSVDEGNTLTLPDDPTKTGYDFKGWFTDDALSAEFDATVAITGDTTLYAKWSVIEYTITYVLNDENATNAATNPAKYTIESEAITLAEPTTTNTEKPHFAGWYSDEALETAATGIAKGSTGNKTFYAKWSDKFQYTVTFYNGETSLGTVKVTEGEKVTIPSTIAVDGYTIEGWYTDSALTKAFDANSVISADTALYAKLIAKVTVKFMNGTEEVDSKTVNSGSKVTAPAAPEKTGYTFVSWKAGTVTLAASAESAAITADTTFEAVWTAITYTIKFDANGGTGTVADIPATYDQEVTLPENTFVYAFANGWNTKADGTGTKYDSGTSVKNLTSTAGSEITLYAQWTMRKIIKEDNTSISKATIAAHPTAKLAVVITNTVEDSSKAGWGAGTITLQTSSDWSSTGPNLYSGFTTPEYGKTKTFFIPVKDLLDNWDDDYDYFYENVYNDASVVSVSIAYGIPDNKSVDLTKLTDYNTSDGGLSKEFASYTQYDAAFTLALSDLGAEGYNCIEIIGQNIVDGTNNLGEWNNNFGAFVGPSSNVYGGASANNMGYAGHYISWTDSSYDTLLIQCNAANCDKIIVTEINLSYVE